MTASAEETGPRRAPLMPWRVVGILLATLGAAGGIAAVSLGPAVVPCAMAGALAGLFGSLMGSPLRAALAVICTLAAFALEVSGPDWLLPVLIVSALSALIGFEAGRYGSRAFVFALFGWLSLNQFGPQAGPLEAAAGFTGSALFGGAIAWRFGFAGRMVAPAAGRFYGVATAIGLTIGLVLALRIGAHLEPAHAQWIAVMLAMRALAQPGTYGRSATVFGVGAVLGAGFAGLVLLLPLPLLAVHAFGVVLLGLGIRDLPAKSLHGPGLISAGIVLATTATMATALFRAEAAAIAALYVLGFTWVAGLVRRRLEPAGRH